MADKSKMTSGDRFLMAMLLSAAVMLVIGFASYITGYKMPAWLFFVVMIIVFALWFYAGYQFIGFVYDIITFSFKKRHKVPFEAEEHEEDGGSIMELPVIEQWTTEEHKETKDTKDSHEDEEPMETSSCNTVESSEIAESIDNNDSEMSQQPIQDEVPVDISLNISEEDTDNNSEIVSNENYDEDAFTCIIVSKENLNPHLVWLAYYTVLSKRAGGKNFQLALHAGRRLGWINGEINYNEATRAFGSNITRSESNFNTQATNVNFRLKNGDDDDLDKDINKMKNLIERAYDDFKKSKL